MFPITALLGIGNKLIDKLIPDPEAKALAQLELAKMAQDGELAKMANETDLYKTEQNNLTDRLKSDMGCYWDSLRRFNLMKNMWKRTA